MQVLKHLTPLCRYKQARSYQLEEKRSKKSERPPYMLWRSSDVHWTEVAGGDAGGLAVRACTLSCCSAKKQSCLLCR